MATGSGNGNSGDLWFSDLNTGVLVAGLNPIYRTTDGGRTWNKVSETNGDTLKVVRFIDAKTGFAAGGNSSLYKTSDSGRTWAKKPLPAPKSLGTLFFPNATTGYAAGEGSVFKTTDGGDSWLLASNTGKGISSLWFTSAAVGYLTDSATGSLEKTTDGGLTWTSLAAGNSHPLLGVRFLDASTGFAYGDSGTVLKTGNGGVTWTAKTPDHPDVSISDIRIIDANNIWLVGYDPNLTGYLYKSTDGGSTWQSRFLAAPGLPKRILFLK
jgi:photosystem II stability/assembly factor-like uncharacterized protein